MKVIPSQAQQIMRKGKKYVKLFKHMIITINSFLFHYCKNDNKLQMYLWLEGKQKYQREAKTNAQCVVTREHMNST
jgi:hypothetical protein